MDIQKFVQKVESTGKNLIRFLFATQAQRDKFMYDDYVREFDTMAENEEFDKIENDIVDYNEEPKLSKADFMKILKNSKDHERDIYGLTDSKDHNCDVIGLIQAADYHVQFEPFYRMMH